MTHLVEEMRYEGALPGKTLASRYLLSMHPLNSSTSLWDFHVKFGRPIAIVNGCFCTRRSALQVTRAHPLGVFVNNDAATCVNHFSSGPQTLATSET